MIKYIEPSQIVEDASLNATAIGVYVTLLHCSSDGKHIKNIRKKELQELTKINYRTLTKYIDLLANNDYLTINKGYDNCFNITLNASNYNYVDHQSNAIDHIEIFRMITEHPEKYSIEETFINLFRRELTPLAIDKIKTANLPQNLVNYAMIGSQYNIDRFVDYDYLINYVLRTVRDWQHKHIRTIDEVKRYMDSHRKGYRFFSDAEKKRLKDDYGIDKDSYKNNDHKIKSDDFPF